MLESWLWQTRWQRDGYLCFLKTFFTALHMPWPAGLDYDHCRRHNNAWHNRTTKWQSKLFVVVNVLNHGMPNHLTHSSSFRRLYRYRESPHSYGTGCTYWQRPSETVRSHHVTADGEKSKPLRPHSEGRAVTSSRGQSCSTSALELTCVGSRNREPSWPANKIWKWKICFISNNSRITRLQ